MGLRLKATQVLYNVDSAITELIKLDKKVDTSGKKAKNSFKKSDKAIISFDNNLTRATRNFIRGFSPAIGAAIRPTDNFLSGVIRLTAELGPLGPAVLGVGAAVGVAAFAFIDFNEVSRNSITEITSRITELRRALETTDLLSNIFDQRELRGFEESLRNLSSRQSDLNLQQASATKEKLVLQQRLDANRETLIQIESNEKRSAKNVQQIRDRALTGGGATGAILNAQITDILDQAAQARRGDDLERASQLLEGARRLSRDAERPDFFLNRIREQEKRIAKPSLTDGEKPTGKSAFEVRLRAENKELEKQIKLVTRRKAIIQPELIEIRAEKRQIGDKRRVVEDTAALAELERARLVTIKAVNDALDTQRTTFEKLAILSKTAVSVAFPGIGIGGSAFVSQVKGISQLKEQLRIARATLQQKDGTEGDIRAGQQLEATSTFFAEASRLEARGLFTNALKKDLIALRIVRTELNEILRIRGELESRGASFIQPIATKSPQLRDDENQRTNGQQAANVENTSINVTVNGTVLDAETIKEIVPIIKRELRKGTGEAPF